MDSKTAVKQLDHYMPDIPDPAARVAQEIFQHNLIGATNDSRMFVQQMPAESAQQFVQKVNTNLRTLASENNFYGQDANCPTNYLDLHPIWNKDGSESDVISMKNVDGKHSKKIAMRATRDSTIADIKMDSIWSSMFCAT